MNYKMSHEARDYKQLMRSLRTLENRVAVPPLSPDLIALKQEIAEYNARSQSTSAKNDLSKRSIDLFDSQELKKLLVADLKANFLWLVVYYQHKLYNFVRYMLQHPQDAEDLVQEIFVKVYGALSSFSPSQWERLELQPWLFAIARRESLNYVSRVSRRQSKQVSLDQPAEWEIFEDTVHKHYPSSEGEVGDREALEELYKCIRQLSDPLRAPVVLHYIIGLPYSEIAMILNQHENTVKSNGRRGFKVLQAIMKEEVK
jgi:RNA polymerase sigma-70 factor, ECF subfamily